LAEFTVALILFDQRLQLHVLRARKPDGQSRAPQSGRRARKPSQKPAAADFAFLKPRR
jgi:hypothetical protein